MTGSDDFPLPLTGGGYFHRTEPARSEIFQTGIVAQRWDTVFSPDSPDKFEYGFPLFYFIRYVVDTGFHDFKANSVRENVLLILR